MTDIKIVKGKESFIIPQKNDSFKNIVGLVVDFDNAPQSAILAMTGLDINKITTFELSSILAISAHIREKFPGYNPPTDISNLTNTFINDLFSESFWHALSTSKDCGFVKMDKRKFPYFSSVDQDWKAINERHRPTRDPYPAEFNGEIKEEKTTTSTLIERKEGWQEIENQAIAMLRDLESDSDIKSIDTANKIKEAIRYRPIKEKPGESGYDEDDSNFNCLQVLESQFYPKLDEYKNFVILLYKSGLTKSVIKILCILPLTYNCCAVIKCDWFWKIWNELIFDEQIKNFVIYYAMYILKLEEIKSYNGVPCNARFIFSLEEAVLISNTLPKIGIDKHALVHLMEPLGYKSSYMPFFLDGSRTINSIETFKQRLSIATGGLLDNIKLSDYKAVLSGSILVPCVATCPLENRFNEIEASLVEKKKYAVEDLFDNLILNEFESEIGSDLAFRTYLECYYPSYKSIPDEELSKYTEPIQTEAEYQKQKFEDLNSDNKIYPDDIAQPVAYGVLSDLDISIHTATFDEFKIRVYELFEAFRGTSGDKRIYIRRIRRGNNFKYSLYGRDLMRPIDLFWITKTADTFVEQFHLGVVRMHWDGNQIRMMQSALAALLTGINHDYRWLSSNKAPPIPVIKYAQRGYTTPLNKNERPVLLEYLCNKTEWTGSLKVQAATQDNIFNTVMENNLFFMPDITKSGIRYGLKELDAVDGIAQKINKSPKINNNRIRWLPIVCSVNGIDLPYYNESRNSIGKPTLRLIEDVIV